jgi:glycosyltransferase involved in cell wall biosynthesis
MTSHSQGPLVTIITATYHSSATLRQAIQSVRAQDFQDFEHLVIGDGCTDDSEAIVQAFNDPRLQWINLAANSGSQAAPNNEGLRRARGRYVAFLGHDDLWFPWHLSTLMGHLESTGADLVHDLALNIGPEGVLDANGPPHELESYRWVYFPTSSWVHRKTLFEVIGGWSEPDALCWPIDYDFTRRVCLAGRRIEFLASLGVLKFPSLCWGNYSRAARRQPRGEYLDEMFRSPGALAQRLLTQAAVQYARLAQKGARRPVRREWPEFVAAARRLLKAMLRAGVEGYGPDRWPVGPVLRRRFGRIRRGNRPRRGLSG